MYIWKNVYSLWFVIANELFNKCPVEGKQKKKKKKKKMNNEHSGQAHYLLTHTLSHTGAIIFYVRQTWFHSYQIPQIKIKYDPNLSRNRSVKPKAI